MPVRVDRELKRANTKTAKVKKLLAMGGFGLREIAEMAECNRSLVIRIKAETRKAQIGDHLATRVQHLEQDLHDLRRFVLSRVGELHPLTSVSQMRMRKVG